MTTHADGGTTLLSLSAIGSWALIAYIVVAAFFIAYRATPGGHDE